MTQENDDLCAYQGQSKRSGEEGRWLLSTEIPAGRAANLDVHHRGTRHTASEQPFQSKGMRDDTVCGASQDKALWAEALSN